MWRESYHYSADASESWEKILGFWCRYRDLAEDKKQEIAKEMLEASYIEKKIYCFIVKNLRDLTCKTFILCYIEPGLI